MSKVTPMYLRRKKELIDPETGDVLDAEVIIRLWSGDRKFIKVFDAFLADLVMDKELSGKPIRLLFYIVSRLPFNEDIVFIDKEQTAKDLKVNRSTLYRWINILLKKGILRKMKARNLYKIQPYAIVRGNMSMVLNNKLLNYKESNKDQDR